MKKNKKKKFKNFAYYEKCEIKKKFDNEYKKNRNILMK